MKDIQDFPGYKITYDGKVYSVKRKKFIKPKPGGYKLYPRIVLYSNGVRYHRWIHRLVATHYIGCCEGKHVHHVDEDVCNNFWKNLKILTKDEHTIAHRRIRARKLRLIAEELKQLCPF